MHHPGNNSAKLFTNKEPCRKFSLITYLQMHKKQRFVPMIINLLEPNHCLVNNIRSHNDLITISSKRTFNANDNFRVPVLIKTMISDPI